jgi:hypothetical protein
MEFDCAPFAMRTTEIGALAAQSDAGPMHVDFLRGFVRGPFWMAIADKIGRSPYPQNRKLHRARERTMLAVQLIGVEERGQLICIEPDFLSLHAAHGDLGDGAAATQLDVFTSEPWPGFAWGGRGRCIGSLPAMLHDLVADYPSFFHLQKF